MSVHHIPYVSDSAIYLLTNGPDRREHEYKTLCTTMAIHVQSERTMETAQEAIDNALLGAPIEWPTLMQKATLPIGKQILRRAS